MSGIGGIHGSPAAMIAIDSVSLQLALKVRGPFLSSFDSRANQVYIFCPPMFLSHLQESQEELRGQRVARMARP